jgi:uncharacterized membrane protein YbhN (UPF0104 family)
MRRNTLLKLLKWGLGIASVAVTIYMVVKDEALLAQAVLIRGEELTTILFLFLLYLLLYSLRFVLLFEYHSGKKLGLLIWLRMIIVMRLLNNLFPQLGTIYRGVTLKRDFGISYTSFVSANLFFIWSDTVFNFVVAGLLLILLGTQLELWGVPAAPMLIIFGLLIAATPFPSKLLLKRIPSYLTRFSARLTQIADEVASGAKDWRYLAKVNLVTLGSMISMILIFGELFKILGVELGLGTLAVFYALYRLTFYINITPGNIGIREFAYGLLCTQAGVSVGTGALVAAEVRIFSLIVLLALGGVLGSRELKSAFKVSLEDKA